MSIHKVAIHAVWRTKNDYPFLKDEIRVKACKHIFSHAKNKDIWIDTIDGYVDHLHCLFYLNPVISLSKTLQIIKGESAKWINDNLFKSRTFGWADDYFAVSVSESNIEKVRKYIKNQKIHHKKITFLEEYDQFLKSIKKYAD